MAVAVLPSSLWKDIKILLVRYQARICDILHKMCLRLGVAGVLQPKSFFLGLILVGLLAPWHKVVNMNDALFWWRCRFLNFSGGKRLFAHWGGWEQALGEIAFVFRTKCYLCTPTRSPMFLSSPCAESTRAVTGRQCPHSGEGEAFLTCQPSFFFITKTAITRERKLKKLPPTWEMNRLSEGYKRAIDQN